jgi:hypothetical protein
MEERDEDVLFDPELWSRLSLPDHRRLLADMLRAELGETGVELEVNIEIGPPDRPYDLTAAIRTEVGTLRAALWSHARATVFCDRSIHIENRKRFAPAAAAREVAEHLRRRLAVPFKLESRGLEVSYSPEDGIERRWSAERSVFRGRTAVTREDRVRSTGEVDLRDLLGRYYAGPSLRVVGEDGSAFYMPGTAESPDGPLIALCPRCRRWEEGSLSHCSFCEGPVDVVLAIRPPRR